VTRQGVAGDPEADRVLRRFGEQLRVIRVVARLSQETVAERAGLSQKTVSFAERGERNLRWSVMYALARGVGHRPGLVFGPAVYADAQQVLLRFGADLREARDLAGLTQERLAERAGVSPKTVSLAELGEQNMRWSVMHALARAVGHRLDLVLDPATHNPQDSGR
jgi:transcriptional regulator with XRE-family HTH domain